MFKRRVLFFYKDYFRSFFDTLNEKSKRKILWTLKLVEELEHIPGEYFKHLKNTSGIYEIRVRLGNNTFRVFCFFDKNNLIIIGNGYQKKTQKTARKEIEKAEKIKEEYYEEKKAKLDKS